MQAGPDAPLILPVLEREYPVDEESVLSMSPDGLVFEEGEALEDFDDDRRSDSNCLPDNC